MVYPTYISFTSHEITSSYKILSVDALILSLCPDAAPDLRHRRHARVRNAVAGGAGAAGAQPRRRGAVAWRGRGVG